MRVDVPYCASSFLIFRHIIDRNKTFKSGIIPSFNQPLPPYYLVQSKTDLEEAIRDYISGIDLSKTALMLSGGMDSAILAKYMPKGTKAYTFRSNIPGTTDESPFAVEYANMNDLDHEVIDIDWQDFLDTAPRLMRRNGSPIHSITPQIYKAARIAKEAGYEILLFGENADAVFGGLDGLLSQKRNLEEFIARYSYVRPEKVLKNCIDMQGPFEEFLDKDGFIDAHAFIGKHFMNESTQSYVVACEEAGIQFASPYNKMRHYDLDLDRVKSGESKYLIRELFVDLYNGQKPRKKTPMPRAVDKYLEEWKGPNHPEFKDGIDISQFSGDQKWMIYVLEWFLNMIESEKNGQSA